MQSVWINNAADADLVSQRKQERLGETQQPEGSTDDAKGELLYHTIGGKRYRNVTICTELQNKTWEV